MSNLLHRWTLLVGILAASLGVCVAKHNILMIAIDDLRPEIAGYGFPRMHTPNMDKLIKEGTMFRRNYVQQAVCSPSRTSLLTGRRPDTTHIYDLWTYFRSAGCNVTTLPQFFKQQGYKTAGHGKIYHPGHASGAGVFPTGDDPPSWTEPYFHSPNKKNFSTDAKAWATPDAPEEDFPDTQIAAAGIATMKRLADKPFFIAVGFHKPHLPFIFPKNYLDYYPEENITIAADPFPPKDMPPIAWSDWGELRNYHDVAAMDLPTNISKDMPDDYAKELRRAYYAATSYTDAQIGKVLQSLDTLGLSANTTVLLWGDHGWQLGELGEWCKHTNFEIAARAPLIVRTPLIPESHGTVVESLVEHVDIYPTLVDLAGFEVPKGLEGFSLVPLLKNSTAQWKTAAFSQYPRGLPKGTKRDHPHDHSMGYSVRTADWRYTEWVYFHNTTMTHDWDRNFGVELYDHRGDDGTSFAAWENQNLANLQEFGPVVKQMSAILRAGPQAQQEQLHTARRQQP
ncbi:ulvan-active sulfatase-like [Sycon ciliatum]|uniref:ulvan-active sulfatase-like n=1 Tax=Sycon ciliatum TaxID=27933 RepID=UPI0031F6A737